MIRLLPCVFALTGCSLLVGPSNTGELDAADTDQAAETVTSDAATEDLGVIDARAPAQVWDREDTAGPGAIGPGDLDLNTVYCSAPNDVYVGGSIRGVAHSTGGGKWTWTPQPTPFMGDVTAISGQAGEVFALANGVFHLSAGKWSKTSAAIGKGHALWAASASSLYLIDNSGALQHSSDGGTNFTTLFSNLQVKARALFVLPNDQFILGASSGQVVRSDAGGKWIVEMVDASAGINGVWASAVNDLYAVGAGGAYHSTGNGQWDRLFVADLSAVWGRSADEVFVAGSKGLLMHFTRARGWKAEGPAVIVDFIRWTAFSGCGNEVFVSGTYGEVLHLK